MICMRHFLAEVLHVKPHNMNLELTHHGHCLLVLLLLSQFYITRGHRIRVTVNSNKISITTPHIPLQKRKTRHKILKALIKAAQPYGSALASAVEKAHVTWLVAASSAREEVCSDCAAE